VAKSIKKLSQSVPPVPEKQKTESKLEGILRLANDFETVSATAKLGVLFLTSDLSIQEYSPSLRKWFRINPKDCGQPVARLRRRLGYDQIHEDADQVLKSHISVEREVRTKSGNSLIVRMGPYYAHDKKVDGVVVTVVDITAQKQVEEMLRNMVDAAPEATLAINEDGIIVLASKQLENVFGYQRGELIGKTVRTLIPERFHQVHLNHRRRYFSDPKVRPMGTGLKLFGRRSDGTEFPVEISLSHLKTLDGMLAIAAIRDVTERVDTERKMRQLATLLSEAEQKERQRVSQMLHDDLQQRLFAIKVNFQRLSDAYQKKDWDTLQTTLTEMEGWLSESISITRDLSKDLSPIIMPGEDFADSLTRLFAEMQNQFALNVVFNSQGDYSNLAASLRLPLFQVVRELLFNIVKHANTLQATVTLEQVDHELRITVSDEGKGFDPITVMSGLGIAHGLISMRERLALVACYMDVVSTSGIGTSIVIHCPNSSSLKN
jgi:two-component system, chemotaxis family, CheB/CheR fusion protein